MKCPGKQWKIRKYSCLCQVMLNQFTHTCPPGTTVQTGQEVTIIKEQFSSQQFSKLQNTWYRGVIQ